MIKNSVKKFKFLPQERNNEKRELNNKAFLNAPLVKKIPIKAKKNTLIPIYAGASRIGWVPQYVGTFFENWNAWLAPTPFSIKKSYTPCFVPKF